MKEKRDRSRRLTGQPSHLFKRHWRLYADECFELAIFMISACFFTVWLFHPGYPALRVMPSSMLRRLLMGMSMGGTAIAIIQSSMGRRSGAHFNPAITATYFRLGKIARWDAVFYIFFQFLGGVLGVGLSALCLGNSLSAPGVDYAVTVPGIGGTAGAFGAEYFMAALLMALVLWFSNEPRRAHFTSYVVGVLITLYVLVFAPVSGFSINPARTTGSAVFAGVWTAVWIYFTAPLLGMMTAAEIYLRLYGKEKVLCAKLHPDSKYPCPFVCHFPLHRHEREIELEVNASEAEIS